MTDITERLRSIYVAEGANYVQEAADTIERLRAESDRAKQYHAAELADVIAERDQLVNDVHSCHDNCTKAGCVNQRLQARVAHIEQLVTDIRERLSNEADRLYAAGEPK
jgi:predicted trehalose synthase